jgi:SAM-dependent methyltransferase
MAEPHGLDALATRLAVMEAEVERLRSPVVADDDVHPPAGMVADFLPPGISPALAQRAASDRLPIPDTPDREGYRPGNHFHYWQMGLGDFDRAMAAAVDLGVSPRRVYDFGGSTGRVFRHFHCQRDDVEVWTSDFKVAAHRWNQLHMPAGIKAFLNGVAPPVPMPDAYFDLITAFSVFTHIDQLESTWLLELRRLLKPGGLLYLTVHDEAFWEDMPPAVLKLVQRAPNGGSIDGDTPFPAPRAAFAFSTRSYYNCNVFHSHEYVQAQWGRFFEVLEIRPRAAERQCVVLLTHHG